MAVSPSLEKITFISLFQHSDTFDMMCVGKHINRNPKNSNRWISDNDEIINKSNKNTSLF